jgi:hypothetical protein
MEEEDFRYYFLSNVSMWGTGTLSRKVPGRSTPAGGREGERERFRERQTGADPT